MINVNHQTGLNLSCKDINQNAEWLNKSFDLDCRIIRKISDCTRPYCVPLF